MRAPTVSSLRTYNISTSGTSHRFPSCGLFVCTRMRTHTRILMRKPNRFFSQTVTQWSEPVEGLTIQRDRTIMSTSRRTLPLGEDKSFAHASVSWASYRMSYLYHEDHAFRILELWSYTRWRFLVWHILVYQHLFVFQKTRLYCVWNEVRLPS